MYFKDFPKFQYDFAYGRQTKVSVVQDITRNIRFRRDVLANISLFDEYDIIDGETPEIIAEKYYGNAEYHWIVMLANERHDYITDFPLPEYTLEKYIISKYGAQRYATHHYEDANGFVVNSDAVGAESVSNDDYERLLNESKRRIKLVSPDLISAILKQYKELM